MTARKAPARKKAAKKATRPRGRPEWKPTDDQRRLVEHYVAMGFTQEQVAALMAVTVDTLAKHCRAELDLGVLRVNAKIGGKLFEKAMKGSDAALIFWAKTRMRWKETSTHEHTGPNGGPIQTQDLSLLSDEELDALAAIRTKLALARPDQGGAGEAGS